MVGIAGDSRGRTVVGFRSAWAFESCHAGWCLVVYGMCLKVGYRGVNGLVAWAAEECRNSFNGGRPALWSNRGRK